MLTRIIAVGLMAGVLSGLVVSGLQHATTVPLILKAEAYENAAPAAEKHKHSSFNANGEARLILVHAEAASAGGKSEAWGPAEGLERTAYTSLTTVGAGVGFALMLLAAMIACGVDVTARSAALWGLGAFVATGLAPGMGLPPELPGAAAADVLLRQAWWISTAAATAAGIWLLFRGAGALALVAGVALMVAPHLIGAPQPHEYASTVPAELAGHFTATSLAVHAVLWALVGAATGYFWQRFGRAEPTA
ncbi:MAG: CbtA family protein [Hyphomicrobium sp.]